MPPNREIERKFLNSLSLDAIREHYRANPTAGQMTHMETIDQCYLGDTGSWTIRLRRVTQPASDYPQCYITMKQPLTPVTCRELETEINFRAFDRMAGEFGPMLRKQRYFFLIGGPVPKTIWSVDRFLNRELDGLELSEIELLREDQPFDQPGWLDREVTHDPQYRNCNLVKRLVGVPLG